MLTLLNAKKIASRSYLTPRRSRKFRIPGYLKNSYQTDQFLVKKREVVTFSMEGTLTNQHIIFLHGGAFSVEVKSHHWRFIRDIIKRTSYKLSFINYPLAPEHTCRDVHEMLFQAYQKLQEIHPEDAFIFIGDSAGAGLCLSFVQTLRNTKVLKLPAQMVLLSPWLDLSLGNPEIAPLERKDLLLDPDSLRISAQYYAGDLDLNDPLVSPLFGNMQDLPRIGIFVGTHEILLPDCQKLKLKLENSNTTFLYKEYPGLQHDWMVFPIKERQVLINDLVDFLKK